MPRKRKHTGNNRPSNQVKQSQYQYQLEHNQEIAEYRALQHELEEQRKETEKYIKANRSSIDPLKEKWLLSFPHLYSEEKDQLMRNNQPTIVINGIPYYC